MCVGVCFERTGSIKLGVRIMKVTCFLDLFVIQVDLKAGSSSGQGFADNPAVVKKSWQGH